MAGSHIVFALQQTRQYKVICIDNYHNSYPKAISRLEDIARNTLPADATDLDKESSVIDAYRCDLTDPVAVRAVVFEKYGKAGNLGCDSYSGACVLLSFFSSKRMLIFTRAPK